MIVTKKSIFISILFMATQCLAMCSGINQSSQGLDQNTTQKLHIITVDMTSFEVFDSTSTIEFSHPGKYFLSYNWADKEEGFVLSSPDSIRFTVSAWNQDNELYYEHLDSSYTPSSGNEFLEIKKPQLNKPIDILVIGTLTTFSEKRQGTLKVMISRENTD